MFQNESRLLIADNSGAKELLIIRCLGGSNRKFSKIGDRVIATVKKAKPLGNAGKGDIVMALIIASKKGLGRSNGSFINFSKNYAILIKKEERRKKDKGQPFKPIGTVISVPVLREFKEWGYSEKFFEKVSNLVWI
ncbi:uL14 family ribosomal protein [endosymbiont GvMRE of Glomus versiforme]|uniref:uL14 family ribosomal protein n=1 Tax=endosymbiont GvMRE of Glomus versiforme TaxID=2039283 RepID=UPI000EE25F52|nr:uL14 family ribosomal protein [endosymbiont GvMRE of Glomus versiforme]RHZ37108.1 50S ribosomal protein L14 [endosymbiont GvMRE of Glomus versiforme]